MERKLVFLTSQVRFGYHKRYQEWFQRQVRENSPVQEEFKAMFLMFNFLNIDQDGVHVGVFNMQKAYTVDSCLSSISRTKW
jgi:hypothetical protein